MITAWTEEAWEEYVQRQKEDERVLDTINRLVKDIKRNPFKGLGRPESSGKGENQQLDIAQCRYHY